MKVWPAILFLCSLVLCAIIAHHLAPLLDVSFKLAYLIALIVTSGLLSGQIAFNRLRLRRRVEAMTKAERDKLGLVSAEIRYALPTQHGTHPRLVALVGSVTINGMVLPLFVGPLAVLQYIFEVDDTFWSAVTLVLGFVLAWIWWSVGVTICRSWAMHHGLTDGEDDLVLAGVEQPGQDRARDVRGPEERQPQPAIRKAGDQASACPSARFLSFFFTMTCFSRESRSTKSTPSR